MENSSQRMFRLLGGKRGMQKALADYIGVNQSNITTWKSRGNELPTEYIHKIAEFLNVSEAYLLTGNEEQQQQNDFFSKEELDLINLYRTSSEKGRYMAMGILVSNQQEAEETKKGA